MATKQACRRNCSIAAGGSFRRRDRQDAQRQQIHGQTLPTIASERPGSELLYRESGPSSRKWRVAGFGSIWQVSVTPDVAVSYNKQEWVQNNYSINRE